MKLIFLLFSIFILNFSSSSQLSIEWQKTIGGSNQDDLSMVKHTIDGGYIIAGTSRSDISGDKTENNLGNNSGDYWIVKTDAIGNIQWQNTMGGGRHDRLLAIEQTIDGGYILGGYSNSDITIDKSEDCLGNMIGVPLEDYWIVKLDATGNIEWDNTIGGWWTEYLLSIKQTSDGGYILGGYSNSSATSDKTENNIGGYDYWIVKINANGIIVWENTIGGSLDDFLNNIIETSDGGFIMGGYSESGVSGDKTEPNKGGRDFWVVKTDPGGIIQWDKTIGGNNTDEIRTIVQTSDGGYLFGGYSVSNISGDKTENNLGGSDYWIVKTDASGNIQWQNTIGGSDEDYLTSMQVTNDGGFILGGHSASNISGDKTENSKGGADYWIVKTDSTGNIQWQNTFGGNSIDNLYSIEKTSESSFILGGTSWSNISGDKSENSKGNQDYWIVKLDSRFNSIKGYLFADLNNNSVQDSGETSLSNHKVVEPISGRFTLSDINGNYKLSVHDTGNFNIQSGLLNFISNPTIHSASFMNYNSIDSLNDFIFQPYGIINDLMVNISPIGPFRPGFNATYNITYKNIGTTIITPTIIFYPDSNLTFVGSTINPNTVNSNVITWILPDLYPFEERGITVTVNVHSATVIGSYISSTAKIEPVNGDTNVLNNISTWRIEVTGAIDPNDILVNRENIFVSELSNPPFLEYLIRFQNTGSDTAFTVKIKNYLPYNVELSSFEFIESSHPVQLMYNNVDKLMWFHFDNILLPDSNVNEPMSHGYVKYKIKSLSSLMLGDLIENEASIFFDFQLPVVTNIATTEILQSGTTPVELFVYPTNPFCYGGEGNAIVNVTGGVPPYSYLWSNGQTNQAITSLTNGNYFITVTDNNLSTATSSFIITDPPLLIISLASTATNYNSPNCNGSVSINPSGGTPPYNIIWSSGTTDNLCEGWYTTTITDANGCVQPDSVYVNLVIGIDELNDEGIYFFPNPVNDIFIINSEKEIGEIKIFDVAGRLIKHELIKNNIAEIDIKEFNAGIYFVEVEDRRMKVVKM